jgi:large subunit ribosomal protein L35
VPKLKTHKGIAKRVRVSARGKLKYKPPGKSHLMSGKSGDEVRGLRKSSVMEGKEARKLKSLLHGGRK